MTGTEVKHHEPYTWLRILYAFMRWTIPAVCAALVILLNR
jgi:hypothetical protein